MTTGPGSSNPQAPPDHAETNDLLYHGDEHNAMPQNMP